MSVVGFVAHYVHFLDPFRRPQPVEQLAERNDNTPSPVLLLAGYSYGAMVTTQLPSLDTILETFKTPVSGSPAAEIRLRAEYMADTENTVLASARAAALDRQGTRSPRKAMAMRVGGDEQNRKSHDIPRRSFSLEAEEKFRDLIAKTRKGHRAGVSVSSMPKKPSSTSIRSVPNEQGEREASKRIQPLAAMTRFQPAYLLISPPQGIITRLATMSMSNPFAKKTARVPDSPPSMPRGADSRTTAAGTSSAALAWEAEHKLVNNPSLAVYGDQDIFVPVKKVREWAQRLQGTPGSRFSAHEISTAGHFWTEEGVLYIMRDALKTFARELLVPEPEARALTR
jgi:pimeloyl-ACP methyl ester carboxylesterase